MQNSVYQLALLRTRQHSNSPILWGIVLAGSLLLNIGVVLAFQKVLQQMQPVPSAFEPVAIEFVESPVQTEQASGTESQPAIAQTGVPLVNPSTAPVAELDFQSEESSIVEQPSIQWNQPPAAPPSSQTVESTTASNLDSSQSQSSSEEQEPILDEQENLPSDSPITEKLDLASEQLEEPAATGVALPPIPNVPNPDENRETAQKPLGDPSAISRNFIPPTVSARVKVNAYQSNVSTTLSETPAIEEALTEPSLDISEDSTQTFSSNELGCSLTPDSLRSFGQPVTLEISLNDQGALDDQSATIQSSSGNDSYNDLAICVLKHWRFNVASSNLNVPRKVISRRLAIDVTLTR